jgi:dihydroorotate dehydrogenase
MYKLTEGKIPAHRLRRHFFGRGCLRQDPRRGASMVQVYTALVFEGPLVNQKMKRSLLCSLRRDGFKSVAEAVGADCQ